MAGSGHSVIGSFLSCVPLPRLSLSACSTFLSVVLIHGRPTVLLGVTQYFSQAHGPAQFSRLPKEATSFLVAPAKVFDSFSLAPWGFMLCAEANSLGWEMGCNGLIVHPPQLPLPYPHHGAVTTGLQGMGAFSRRAANSGLGTKNTGVQHRNSGRSKKCVQEEPWARQASPPHARPRISTEEGGAQATAVREIIIALPVFWCIFSRTFSTHIRF